MALAVRASICALAIASLAACASSPSGAPTDPAPAPEPIQTVQAGDASLSCQALTTQIAELDQMSALPYGSSSVAGDGVAKNAARSTATQAVARGATTNSLGAIPILGAIASLGMNVMDRNEQSSANDKMMADANRRSEAMQRKAHLVQIFTDKKC